jgi:hypothetical protein
MSPAATPEEAGMGGSAKTLCGGILTTMGQRPRSNRTGQKNVALGMCRDIILVRIGCWLLNSGHIALNAYRTLPEFPTVTPQIDH